MSVKTLRKQLLAAIAMVLVAAIALGSSTYAWFVTNNTVKATTSQISAQSNAAFMTIANGTSGAKDADSTYVTTTTPTKPLYPAEWANHFDSAGAKYGDSGFTTGVYQFETAYAETVTNAGIKESSRKVVGAPSTACDEDYALLNEFNVSTKGTNLKYLRVQNVTIGANGDPSQGTDGNDQFADALRVLVMCGTNWAVYTKDGTVESSNLTATNGREGGEVNYLAENITVGNDTSVNVYVYYDGDTASIYTNNLGNLTAVSSSVTVTFTADALNH